MRLTFVLLRSKQQIVWILPLIFVVRLAPIFDVLQNVVVVSEIDAFQTIIIVRPRRPQHQQQQQQQLYPYYKYPPCDLSLFRNGDSSSHSHYRCSSTRIFTHPRRRMIRCHSSTTTDSTSSSSYSSCSEDLTVVNDMTIIDDGHNNTNMNGENDTDDAKRIMVPITTSVPSKSPLPPTTIVTKKHMMLLSLQWSELNHPMSTMNNNNNNNYTIPLFSKTVYDIWKWKDIVLGDGRDYFIPKSNTLRALQNYIITQQLQLQQLHRSSLNNNTGKNMNTTTKYTISECVILSNCARFEIMFVIDVLVMDDTTMILEDNDHQIQQQQQLYDQVVSDISYLLYAQVQSYQQQQHAHRNIFATSTTFLDRPNDIDPNAMMKLLSPNNNNSTDRISNDLDDDVRPVQEIQNHWNVWTNVSDIIFHLCTITVGIASRPKRPDRNTVVPVFRPFSSRDAHILLQFKRTTDIATSSKTTMTTTHTQHTNQTTHRSSGNNHILRLLQYAIRAGKAARNPQRIPLLYTLRQEYGETGNSYKYDVVPPTHVMEPIIQSVYDLVIYPTVHECVHYFETMCMTETSSSSTRTIHHHIQSLRQNALALATTNEERQYILTQLHLPTIKLRQLPTLQRLQQQRSSNILTEVDDTHHHTDSFHPKTSAVWNETKFLEELTLNLTNIRNRETKKKKHLLL